ncbi:hypothetical protein ISF_05860 [Cordyceps fumosorosea ARSEF 2679]|uniref:Uncharacterized protein n=1 Tax=Cordyceps fumosorosea (strain ARSEF 2679) TaxID=1081104 RepID=A0A167TPT7_CORFA|nr:hypothetical protein ISF_05860 [Cordyceps fumosorosea ARSEF 2679]OAA60821.1 hypothetical protein ISF_05860 [Cordyceps fumosorosea ARSEF 2679]
MASIIIVVIACSKSLYKAGKKRRDKKRELAALAHGAAADKPSVRRRSAQPPARRPRRVLDNNGSRAVTTTYNSNGLVPGPDEQGPVEMTAAHHSDLADLESLTRASTIASEPGEGRRRMSDESTLAEVARDGAWTART